MSNAMKLDLVDYEHARYFTGDINMHTVYEYTVHRNELDMEI